MNPNPGWYPNPLNPAVLIYWDGTKWLMEHQTPNPNHQLTSPAPIPSQPVYTPSHTIPVSSPKPGFFPSGFPLIYSAGVTLLSIIIFFFLYVAWYVTPSSSTDPGVGFIPVTLGLWSAANFTGFIAFFFWIAGVVITRRIQTQVGKNKLLNAGYSVTITMTALTAIPALFYILGWAWLALQWALYIL